MSRLIRWPLIVLLACAGVTGLAAEQLEVISLTHRAAEEITPLLKPHLSADASLSGANQQLILRAPAAELARLRGLVAELDVAPQSLLISVRSERSGRREFSGGRAATEPSTSVRVYGTRRQGDGEATQSVRALAGRPAHIARAVYLPVTATELSADAQGTRFAQQHDQIHASNGFYATAHLSGESVRLAISVAGGEAPQRRQPFQRQQVVTELQGRLGEWILLTDHHDRRLQADSGVSHRTRSRGLEDSRIWLRVERLE